MNFDAMIECVEQYTGIGRFIIPKKNERKYILSKHSQHIHLHFFQTGCFSLNSFTIFLFMYILLWATRSNGVCASLYFHFTHLYFELFSLFLSINLSISHTYHTLCMLAAFNVMLFFFVVVHIYMHTRHVCIEHTCSDEFHRISSLVFIFILFLFSLFFYSFNEWFHEHMIYFKIELLFHSPSVSLHLFLSLSIYLCGFSSPCTSKCAYWFVVRYFFFQIGWLRR